MKPKLLFFFFFLASGIAFAQKPQTPDSELQKLKAELAAAKHDTTRMMAYVDISIYFREVQIQDDSALLYALKAKELAEQYPAYIKTPRAWNCIGKYYDYLFKKEKNSERKNNYFKKALFYFNKTANEAKNVGNEEYYDKGWFNITILYVEKDSIGLYFKTAHKLIERIESKQKLNRVDSIILSGIYSSFCTILDYDMNSTRFNRYLALCKKYRNSVTDDYIYQILKFEQHSRLWDKSKKQNFIAEYDSLKTLFAEDNKYLFQLQTYYADYYSNIGEYQQSLDLTLNFAKNQNIRPNNNLEIINSNIGKIYFMLKKYDLAIIYLKKGLLGMESNVSMFYEKFLTLQYLSKAYHAKGNSVQAYQYLTQAEVLRENVFGVELQSLIGETEVQQQKIIEEKKLNEAHTQTLLKEQEIEIQKKQKYVVSGLLLITLLVAAWAFYNFQKKNELSKKLETKNKIISQQAEELAESNQLKDKIFALLSHDLRSPINRLIVALGSSIENQRMALMQELYNVQGVLNNVLYWSSMQVKGIKPLLTEVHLKFTIDSVLKEFEHLFQEKQLTPINAIGGEVMLVTDENYLKIILRNLINNAIKFTEPHGFIHINYQIQDNKALLVVKDTGIGMNAQKIATLFHYPVATAGTNSEMGSGLGLSLCYEMVKQLKGKLQVDSQEGQGTKVAIELPI